MLLIEYLQTIVSVIVLSSIIIKLSQDIYKTREKQKTRKGLLKLNWTIPSTTDEIGNKFSRNQHALRSGVNEKK